MNVRIDYILIAVLVIALWLIFIFVGHYWFQDHNNQRNHQYDTEFEVIVSELQQKKYQEAIVHADHIIAQGDLGHSDIRARTYKAVAQLKLGSVQEASIILQGLIDQYPGIKMVYGPAAPHDSHNLENLFESILTVYLDPRNDGVNSEMTLVDIIKSMKTKHWLGMFGIIVGSIAIYERVRKNSIGSS